MEKDHQNRRRDRERRRNSHEDEDRDKDRDRNRRDRSRDRDKRDRSRDRDRRDRSRDRDRHKRDEKKNRLSDANFYIAADDVNIAFSISTVGPPSVRREKAASANVPGAKTLAHSLAKQKPIPKRVRISQFPVNFLRTPTPTRGSSSNTRSHRRPRNPRNGGGSTSSRGRRPCPFFTFTGMQL